jgi:hypothetical protein
MVGPQRQPLAKTQMGTNQRFSCSGAHSALNHENLELGNYEIAPIISMISSVLLAGTA